MLNAESAKQLASVAPREELLSRLAGGIAAPMREFASLLQAIPASFAYGLKALIDAGGAAVAPVAEEVVEEVVEEVAAPEPSAEETATEETATPEVAEEATAEVADEAPEETPETPAEDSVVEQDDNETVADAAAEEE